MTGPLSDAALATELARTTRFARLRHVAECDTTQDLAASDSGPGSAVFWADHQTRGRGREGRDWHDEPGLDLAVTFRVTGLQLPQPVMLPACVPLCIAAALDHAAGTPLTVKWPNDVFARGRKLAGVLIDGRGDRAGSFLIGIGINVNRTRFPPELEATATSLALLSGHEQDRAAVLRDVAQALDGCLADLQADRTAPWLAAFRARLGLLGRPVRLQARGAEHRGTLTALDFEHVVLDGAREFPLGLVRAMHLA